MSRTIAVVISVAALTFASGAQAGSYGSYFWGGGGHGHGGGHGGGGAGEEGSGVCERIRNPLLRYLCFKIKNHHDDDDPVSPD